MKRTISLVRVAAVAAVVAGGLASAPAMAGNGCNGVVNVFVWGCAPWDNNNGAKYPYYRKSVVNKTVPQGAQIKIDGQNAMVNVNGDWKPVDGGAAAVIAAGGGNVVASGGGNVVAAGGMNLRVVEGR